jgi:hypothetical protein
VQWYFDFEKNKFHHDSSSSDRTLQGYRKEAEAPFEQSMTSAKRMKHSEHRLMGSEPGIGNSHGMKNSGSIFRIKTYYPLLTAVPGVGADAAAAPTTFVTTHYGDKIRVFAKCMIGGRPGDHVDIMILTQSS